MLCASCCKIITLPNGAADTLALPGDLCDECMEAERVAASMRQEMALEEMLDRRLRERP